MNLPDKVLRNKAREQVTEACIPDLIVSHMSGSHAYGMNTPTSDVDVRGIFCAPRKCICTPFNNINEQTIPSMEDAKVYEVSRFIQMYTDANPNILETLWVDEEDILTGSEAYTLLRNHRQQLLSKKVAFTYSGYALSQLKRVKGHKKWINNPCPVNPPKQSDYVSLVQNFTDDKILPSEFSLINYKEGCRLIPFGNNLFGLYVGGKGGDYNTHTDDGMLNMVFVDESRVDWGAPQMIVKWNKEDWAREKETHKNYWTWKRNRNPIRAALEEEHGADMKHVSHLVRLLRSVEEILTEGVVKVRRPDAEELLAIRNGSWQYDDIIKWAEDKDKLIRTTLYNQSELRNKPNLNLAGKLMMTIQDIYWEK